MRRPVSLSRAMAPVLAAGVAVAFGLLAPSLGRGQVGPKATYLVSGSFELPPEGQPGGGKRAAAVAVSADGAVHIVDEDGIVFVFDSVGGFVRAYGQGRLQKPVAVEIEQDGTVFVLDVGARAVSIFRADGEYLGSIGSRGSRAGQLDDPVDVAIGPSGHVYVLDKRRKGIQVFSRDGVFIRAVSLGEAVREPAGLAVGRDGRILVSDRRTPASIHVYPPFSDVPWVGGAGGPAEPLAFRGAAFQQPLRVATNELGTVIVLDNKTGLLWSRNRHSEELAGGDDKLYGGVGSARGSFRDALDIAFADADDVLILDRRLRKIERIQLTTETGRALTPEFGFPMRVTRASTRVPGILHAARYRPDGTALLLVSERQAVVRLIGGTRERWLTVYGDTVHWPVPSAEAFAAEYGQGFGEVGGAVMNDTMVVVADSKRNRFSLFRLEDGVPLGTFGDNYEDERRLKDVRGVELFPDGHIALGDKGNNRVAVFSADVASLLASFPLPKAYGVAVAPDGRLLIWDEAGSVVMHGSLAGDGLQPLPPGLVPEPVADATFDDNGNLFLLHRPSGRVTVVDAALERVLIQLGTEGELKRPSGIVVDRDANIFVADAETGQTVAYRWDTRSPPLSGLNVAVQAGAAVLSWEPRPERFVRHYEVQGSSQAGGRYAPIGTSRVATFRIDPSTLTGELPRFVRVAPLVITGVVGAPTEPLPVLDFTAVVAFERQEHAGALRDAREALVLADRGALALDEEARRRLEWIAFVSAYEEGEYAAAVEWGEKLRGRVAARQQGEYWTRLQQAHFNLRSYVRALEGAQWALDHVGEWAPSGAPAHVEEALVRIAFASAYELRDYRGVVAWGERLAARVPAERQADFYRKVPEAHLQLGEPDLAALKLLRLGGESTSAGMFRDSTVVALSFRIAMALQEADTAQTDTTDAGLSFLEQYMQIMPGTAAGLRAMYEDSLAIYRARVALGPALEHWRSANFAEVIRFVRGKLRDEELPPEDARLGRQLLAAAYFTFGRQDDARAAFRAIYGSAPDFDLEQEVERVQRLYNVTLYSPEMLEFFRGLQPARAVVPDTRAAPPDTTGARRDTTRVLPDTTVLPRDTTVWGPPPRGGCDS